MKSVCELEVAQNKEEDELHRRIVRSQQRSYLYC